MANFVNRFIKGIVSDLNAIDIDNQSWVFPTMNVRITKQGDMMVAKPVKGNRILFQIKSDYKIIGAKEYNNILYLVLFKEEGSIVEIGSYPSVPPLADGFQNSYGPLRYNSGTWNFGNKLGYDGRKVDLKFSSSYDGTVDIYLNDRLNSTYVVNNCFNSLGDFIDRSVPYESLPNSIRLLNSSNKPAIFDSLLINNGGELRPGNYQFFLRYSNKSFDTTLFISQSDIVSIVSRAGENRIGKYKSKNGILSKTTKEVTITLSGLDPNYDYFQIGYVLATGNQGDESFYESFLVSNYYSTLNDTEIHITGREVLETISLDEIAAILSIDNICKAQTIFRGRYIGANWESSDYDKDYAQLAKKAYASTASKLIIEGENEFDACHMNKEFYPYAIVFAFADGRETDAYPLSSSKGLEMYQHGLVKIWEDDTANYNKHLGVNIDIEDLKNELLLSENKDIIGFYIVRGERIKNQIASGIVVPMFDAVNLIGTVNYFYNRQAGAKDGYAIPNTFFENTYPTQTVDSSELKSGYSSCFAKCSTKTKKKLAFFGPETIFDDISNLSYLDGDEVNFHIYDYIIGNPVLNSIKNATTYYGFKQDVLSFPKNIDTLKASAHFVKKGTKKSNGSFSAFIPDRYLDEGATNNQETPSGGWFVSPRSAMFSNYIGLDCGDIDDTADDSSFDETTDGIFADGLFPGANSWNFLDNDTWSLSGDNAHANGGSDDLINLNIPTFVEADYPIMITVKIAVSNYVSGRAQVVFTVVPDGGFEEPATEYMDEDKEYFVSIPLAEFHATEDESSFPYLESIKIISDSFVGDIDYIKVFSSGEVQEDDQNIISDFRFKAKLSRLFKYKDDSEYDTSVQASFQIRSTFYQKVSQFIPKETELNSIEIFNADTYTGKFMMRGHKWFGALRLHSVGVNSSRIYQHGSYLEFYVKTDINIFARSRQAIADVELAGDYSFLPYENDRITEWAITSSAEKDMYESTLLNAGYSNNNSVKRYVGYDDVSPEKSNIYPTRLRSSDKRVSGAYFNAFKKFRANQYQDFDEQFGPIVGVYNITGMLVTVQHDSINQHYVNEKGGGDFDLVLGSSEKFIYEEFFQKASYGAQNRDHILETPNYLYGVDIKNMKIWRISTGASPEGKQLLAVEDLTVSKLNYKYITDLITAVTKNLLDINIGYDETNAEILFTFTYMGAELNFEDPSNDPNSANNPVATNRVTLVFSEKVNNFIGNFSSPSQFYSTLGNKLISAFAENVYINDDEAKQLTFFGIEYPMIFSYISNGSSQESSPLVKKFFEAISLRCPNTQLVKIDFQTDSQKGTLTPFFDNDRFWLQPEYNEYNWDVPIPVNKEVDAIFDEGSVMKGLWLKVTLEFQGEEEFYVVYASTKFNPINY